jgi:hypothetical protein
MKTLNHMVETLTVEAGMIEYHAFKLYAEVATLEDPANRQALRELADEEVREARKIRQQIKSLAPPPRRAGLPDS